MHGPERKEFSCSIAVKPDTITAEAQKKRRRRPVMKAKDSSYQMIVRLMFRLLPIQILLTVIGSINNLVSSLFAGNVIGLNVLTITI